MELPGESIVFSHKYKTFYFFIALDRSRLSCGYFITAVYVTAAARGNPSFYPRRRPARALRVPAR